MPMPPRRPTPTRRGSQPTPSGYRRPSGQGRAAPSRYRRGGSGIDGQTLLLILGILVMLGIIVALIITGPKTNESSILAGSQPALQGPGRDPSTQSSQATDPTRESTVPSETSTQYTSPPVVVQPTPTQESVKIYEDERVPNYRQTNPQWETFHYEWDRQDHRGSMWIEITLDANMYAYYRGLERYQGVESYYNYVVDENNRQIIQTIVELISDVGNDLSYSEAGVAREVAKFVQDVIEYQYDSDSTGEDEYPRYPIETLYERRGDCEDTSILMAALLNELGYEVGFIHLPGHVAVALRTSDTYSDGPYYEVNGHRYLFIESTGSGWNIGDIPDDCMDVEASFYFIP